ncbi:MAG: rhodanese-like domain-containing protein [Desulfuromonadaceae bacterium]|nr:rhodanese-like domain-containing protein [Desulfuromonadaceae bacterium]MDD2850082.1 rhodanese-like domain-containing protein [Desulfuromonadaceae bacterium]MDD4130371.1 rhodanese-like domain-containing protein [Desulfuromonadaceae bacterium]
MKNIVIAACILIASFCSTIPGMAEEKASDFDTFLTNFDYDTRADMKTDSKKLLKLLEEKKAVLVDIRFPEETRAWRMGFGLFIPLNELPKRLAELPRDKIIVTACPHKDRSSIAMAYLRTKGYNARYLTDGLIGLAENLRGDSAKEFLEDAGLVKP